MGTGNLNLATPYHRKGVLRLPLLLALSVTNPIAEPNLPDRERIWCVSGMWYKNTSKMTKPFEACRCANLIETYQYTHIIRVGYCSIHQPPREANEDQQDRKGR